MLTSAGQKDYKNSQLLNAIFEQRSSSPTTPVVGRFWQRTDQSDEAYIHKTGGDRIIITAEKGVNALSAATADYAMGGFKITGVADPVSAQDAATKAYVDAGVLPDAAYVVDAVITQNLTVASPAAGPFSAILINKNNGDTYTPNTGDRVWLGNQTTGTEKGIWIYNGAGVAMTRPPDWAVGQTKLRGITFAVSGGVGTGGALCQVTNGGVVGTYSPNFLNTSLSNFNQPSTDIRFGNHNIINLADPLNAQDGATKNYVDTVAASITPTAIIKTQVDAAAFTSGASSNVTVASPGAAIDGVTMSAGMRVLLAGQTSQPENGIYIWNGAAVPMTRALDANSALLLPNGFLVSVKAGGTNNGRTVFEHTTAAAITLGTTSLKFDKVGGQRLDEVRIPTGPVNINHVGLTNCGEIDMDGGGTFLASQTDSTANHWIVARMGGAGDTQYRYVLRTDGQHWWSGGTGSMDSSLKREGAGILAVRNGSADSAYGIMRVLDPVGATDAATKAYVDGVAQGIRNKTARAASTANVASLSGPQTIDTVSLIAGDTVLLKNQTTTSQNGVWTVNAGAWTRVPWMDTPAEVDGANIIIEDGSQAGSMWVSTSEVTTINTDPIAFTQFNAASDITASGGLTKTGLNIAISDPELLALMGLTSGADLLPYFTGSGTAGTTALSAVARTLLAQTTQALMRTTGLGLTATGDALATAASAAAARATLGACGQYDATFGDGSSTSYVFNPGTTGTGGVAATGFTARPTVMILDAASGDEVSDLAVNISGTFVITVSGFLATPTAGQYRLVATGPK